MRKYFSDPSHRNADGAILVHYMSGRVLITDKNGIYDSFIKSKLSEHGGNLFIILVNGPELSPYDSPINESPLSQADNEFDDSQESTKMSHLELFQSSLFNHNKIKILANKGK